MPDNKSHHYVPRFYLRNFTRTEKSIDLFNIDSGRLIREAPIKGQCCRDYFYGKNPENEKSLSQVEGQVADLFRLISSNARLPRAFTAGHLILCFHIVTQAYRTQYAVDTLNELTDGMWRAVMKHDQRVTKEMLSKGSFGFEDPALISIGRATQGFSLIMDLECRVLLAPQGTEFITSDNPVVMYNQFMYWRNMGSNTGLASKGLQIFFPIWPFLTLVMYDSDVYSFGRSKSTPIHMASEIDVHELNMLQVATASKNVYIHSPKANIFKVVNEATRYRRNKKVSVKTFPQPDQGDRRSELITTSHEDIRIGAKLSFLRIHKHARSWLEEFQAKRYQPAVVVRNKNIVDRFEAHLEAVKTGKARPEDAIQSIFGKIIPDGTF